MGKLSNRKKTSGSLDYSWSTWRDPKILYFQDLSDAQINEMLDYVHEFDLELIRHDTTDVSDASYQWDTVSTFHFKNEKDAVMFKLKFS